MLYERLQRFKPDGTLQGQHVRDWPADGTNRPGPVRRPTPEDLAAMDATIETGYVQRIAELEAEIAKLKADHAAELEAARGARQAGADARLAELYATLPPEVQIAFAPVYAAVASLMDRGRQDLAAAYVATLQVEPQLEALRDQFAAILAPENAG